MAAKIAKNRINFKGKTVSIGIDIHKRSWHITALADGEIVLTVTLSKPNYDAFKKLLSQFKRNYVRIAYPRIGGSLRSLNIAQLKHNYPKVEYSRIEFIRGTIRILKP